MLVETMNEGFGILDENMALTYVNNRFLEMLGYSKDEIICRQLIDFFDETNQKILLREMEKRRNGERELYEIEWIAKDGRKIPTLLAPEPIFDDDGKFRGSFAVITEITELRKA